MIEKDRIIRATGAKAPMRLVVIDLTRAANEMASRLGAKSYPAKLLAETAIASLFLSNSLKFRGTISTFFKFSGDISQIQADSTPEGLVRATISHNELVNMNQAEPSLLPKNFEVIKTNEEGKRIQQSIIDAVQGTVSQNLASYLLQSEQVRSAVGIEAKVNEEDPSKLDYAIGFMVEAYPDLSEKDLAIMEQVVLTLPELNSFYKDGNYDLDGLLDLLRGPYEIEIIKEQNPVFFCPCTEERILKSLVTLPERDLKDLASETKPLEIICDFCRTAYHISPEKFKELLTEKKGIN